MKTLITGGTGLLGRFLVRRLIDSGDVVRVLVRSSDSTRDLFGVKQSGLEEMTGDLRDPSSLKRALHGMDAVCHCAAHVKAGGPWSEFEDITVKGTKSLLECSCQEGVKRFLHVSSLGVFGLNGQETVTEESPFDESEEERGHYTRSKIMAERLVWKYSRERGLPVTIIRPGVLYGPGRSPFIARVSFPLGKRLRIAIGHAAQRLPLAYVENVADAIYLALKNSMAAGRAYNVVEEGIYHGEYLDLLRRVNLNKARTVLISPTPFYPLLSSMERLCRWLGLKALIHRHQFERALASPSYDTSRTRLELGWSPQVGVAEGLRRIRDERG